MALLKRVVVCLDVRHGKVIKGVNFEGIKDIGDPVDFAVRYDEQGVDELVFYDITASAEDRNLFLDVVENVAASISIPFAVGGGIDSLESMRAVLLAGAEKVSLNSAAVRNPGLLAEGAEAFGSQCVVLGVDAKKVDKSDEIPSGYEVVIQGGRTPTGRDVLEWVKEAEELGAGEICLNAIDTDGVRDGYEIELTRMVADAVSIPVIASGGAGEPAHLTEAVTDGGAEAALVASIVHYGDYTVDEIKAEMAAAGVPVRLRD